MKDPKMDSDEEEMDLLDDLSYLINSKSSKSPQKLSDDNVFLDLLKSVGSVLFNKSQTTDVKLKKRQALIAMRKGLSKKGYDLTTKQINKKLDNLKSRAKLKSVRNKEHNLKASDKVILDLISAQDKTSNTPTKVVKDEHNVSQKNQQKPYAGHFFVEDPLAVPLVTANKSIDTVPLLNSPKSSSNAIQCKSEKPNNNDSLQPINEVPVQSNNEDLLQPKSKDVQQTILEQKLKLIQMQMELIEEQRKQQREQHAAQMVNLAWKKKIYEAKFNTIKNDTNTNK